MKIDTSDYYPWSNARKRPAEKLDSDLTESKMKGDDTETTGNTGQSGPATPEPESVAAPLGLSDDQIPAEIPPTAPEGWLTNLSHLLSWVLSPVLTPTYGILAVFYLSMFSYAPTSAKWTIIALVFSLTCVIPCAAIWVLTKYGDVSDMALTRRTDRLLPYIIMIGCLTGCGYYLTRTGLPNWVGYFTSEPP